MNEVTQNPPAPAAGTAVAVDPIASAPAGNLPAAIGAGLIASLAGAIVWAVITVATKMQIGFMAVGVGLLVGWAVRRFGQGTQPVFGVIGAALALLGCAAGNLLSACSFLASAQGKGILDVVGLIAPHPAVGVRLMQATFNEMDLFFYAIAVYEGYKLARIPTRR
ncbi:MAG TPA: hypothetical protein VEY89_12270 [Candidatus Dormibacteraeota bacterium]|nr:hypothetical protein [Candidatus Dormibacteraeota bacterium]